jgi:Zinc-binding
VFIFFCLIFSTHFTDPSYFSLHRLQSATARARKLEADKKKGKGSQLQANAACMSIVCSICRQVFMNTTTQACLQQHQENKHSKNTFADCFPSQ